MNPEYHVVISIVKYEQHDGRMIPTVDLPQAKWVGMNEAKAQHLSMALQNIGTQVNDETPQQLRA